MPWVAFTNSPYIETLEPLYIRYYQDSDPLIGLPETIPVCFAEEETSETITIIHLTNVGALIVCNWNDQTWILQPVIRHHTEQKFPTNWIFIGRQQQRSDAFR
jgi:hypothetical protein